MSPHRGADAAVNVAIVARVRIYRESVATALRRNGRFIVGCCVPTIANALGAVEAVGADVALVDTNAAELPAAVEMLRSGAPHLRVVALTLSGSAPDVIACAEAGVSGFVTADSSIDELLDTFLSVANGEMPCSPQIAASLLDRIGVLASGRGTARSEPRLTTREREVVSLIARGMSNKEIASRLCIEVTTVKNHVHNILEKLHVRRRDDAAAWALAHRMAEPLSLILDRPHAAAQH